MFYASGKKGEFIFKQGDKASCFFIIEQGKVDVFIGDVHKKTLNRGEGFGELALLYNAPRSASIQCQENTFFWVLERKTFKQVDQSNKDCRGGFEEAVQGEQSLPGTDHVLRGHD